MPKQETFFEQQSGTATIKVLKSYDSAYAREAFKNMDDDGLKRLWLSLDVENKYDADELPPLGQPSGEGEDFLWDEVLESAREYGMKSHFSSSMKFRAFGAKASGSLQIGRARRASRKTGSPSCSVMAMP